MALTLGTGPLGGKPAGDFNFALDDAPRHRIYFEPFPRRLRALVGDRVVLDSTRGRLLYETAIPPVAYVPLEDLDASLLTRTATSTHCPFKGDASYWTLNVGDRVIDDAVWGYEQPLDPAPWLQGFVALYWDKVDAWYVEDERVPGRLRDPYHRVDVLDSSRTVTVRAGGIVVAETTRPKMLFETGLPPTAYVPPADVRPGMLVPSAKRSVCAYKGEASYWSLDVDGTRHEDVAWSYEHPLCEATKAGSLVAFAGEGIEVTVEDSGDRLAL
jgi:uncharacterized protein (DUF427 family)